MLNFDLNCGTWVSDTQRLQNRLLETVKGSITNHANLFYRDGWITYAPPDTKTHPFNQLSFSGANAHLIHTIAQYKIWEQGKRDWKLKHQTKVKIR